MSLSLALPELIRQVQDAYESAKRLGSKAQADSDAVIQKLADDLAEAIHKYMLKAQVTTTDVINPGQPVIPVPAVTATAGQGTGTGNLV